MELTAEDEQALEDFLDELGEREASPQAMLGAGNAELKAERERAAVLFKEAGISTLSKEERQVLAGKRIPDLQEIALRMAEGLEQVPGFAAGLPSPGLLYGMVRLDRAAGRHVRAGQMLASGGQNGALLAVATTDAMCERAIDQARAEQADPDTDAGQRVTIDVGFMEPFRLQEARKAREQAAKPKDQDARPPIRTDEERQAMARLLQAYLESKGGRRGAH